MTPPFNGMAEGFIVARLADVLRVELVAGGRIDVGSVAHVQVDARSAVGAVLIEAYVRHGALTGA